MYQYRIFSQFTLFIRRILLLAAAFFLFLFGIQVFRVFHMLWRVRPWAAYLFIGCLALALLMAMVYFIVQRKKHRILNARGFNFKGSTSHADLKKYLKYLIHYIKRLAGHRLFNETQATTIRQKAHDLQEVLNHHPLNDDLTRAIATARDQVIAPAFGHLHEICNQVTASKARSAIQDLYQPPFPVIAPLVVFYHQFTLISEITDIYITRPSLREYLCVLSDAWQVMTKGDFSRYGQRLFAGINSNNFSLGRVGEDLGQAFSIIWLTNAFSITATHRCCTLHDWNVKDAIIDMDFQRVACLERTRALLLQDAMPILRKRIRHYTPVDHDPNQFVDEISNAFIKSVDSVVIALSTTPRENSAGKTSPGLVTYDEIDASAALFSGAAEAAEPGHHLRRRRRRHRNHSSSHPFHNLLQRIIYMGQRPKR